KRRSSPSPAPGARAVGYVTGRDRAETRRRAQAIERACSERGWTLARVVQEGHGDGAQGKARRGLAVALDQLAEGAGDRLVACRLQDLGPTRRDRAEVLASGGGAPEVHRVFAMGTLRIEGPRGPLTGDWLEQRPGQLLRFLVCERWQIVPADVIGEAIWPHAGPAAPNTVRHFV